MKITYKNPSSLLLLSYSVLHFCFYFLYILKIYFCNISIYITFEISLFPNIFFIPIHILIFLYYSPTFFLIAIVSFIFLFCTLTFLFLFNSFLFLLLFFIDTFSFCFQIIRFFLLFTVFSFSSLLKTFSF